jgi:multicomponent Na+:H+ antiporter subunit A
MGLSLITLAAGWGLYRAVKPRLEPMAAAMHRLESYGPARGYELALEGLYRFAGLVTRALQTGYLRHYLLAILTVTLLVVAPLLLRGAPDLTGAGTAGLRLHEALLALLLVAGAVAAVLMRSRLAAVAALGVTGVAVALLFALFSGPDLAMTQMVVEVLTVILLVLVFYHLPQVVRRSRPAARVRDIGLAVGLGAVMSLLVLAAAGVDPAREVSEYFLASSGPEAHGRNVVNVILVDFRALDTLGEITVLAVAGLGVFSLLRLKPSKDGEEAS